MLFFTEQDDTLTQDYAKGAVLGTADYLSPEQALDCHEVDIRSDIYSLGATFYTLLIGKPPFHGSKITQKLIDHQIKEPLPLHQINATIPHRLSEVVAKMMAKKPESRHQTPAEVIEALRPWAKMDHVVGSPRVGGTKNPSLRRHAGRRVLAAAVLAVAVVGAAVWFLLAQ